MYMMERCEQVSGNEREVRGRVSAGFILLVQMVDPLNAMSQRSMCLMSGPQ